MKVEIKQIPTSANVWENSSRKILCNIRKEPADNQYDPPLQAF